MAGKGKESHVRRWTKEEMENFANVLADPVYGFAFCLDRLALKKCQTTKFTNTKRKALTLMKN